jgi:hypothetical protein
MRIQELMEARMQDSLPHLLTSISSLEKLYTITMPGILSDFTRKMRDGDAASDSFGRGMENRDIRTVTMQLGAAKSKWFTENYFSYSKSRRDLSGTGLKTALIELSKIPELQSIPAIRKLAHLDVNINPNNKVAASSTQRMQGLAPKEADIKTYGELMGEIELEMPEILEKIGKIIGNPELSARGTKLDNIINQWYNKKDSTVPKVHQDADKIVKRGDAYHTHRDNGTNLGKSDMMKPAEKPVKKHDTYSQNMSAAQDAINQGFELLKKNGVRDHELHAIRQKVQKSDNQLMALMQVFQEFGINPNALMEAWLRIY